MNFIRTGFCKERICFSTFSNIFLHTFPISRHIFSYIEQTKKFLFHVEIKISNTKNARALLNEYIASVSAVIRG